MLHSRLDSAMSLKIRVLLVDDHPFILEGLRAILAPCSDMDIVACAMSGEEAIEAYEAHCPSVVVMDISLPRMSGLEATTAIRERWPDAKVLILSMHSKRAMRSQAVALGARGYLTKDAAPTQLVRAIRTIHETGDFYTESVTAEFLPDSVAGENPVSGRVSQLSNREREILQLIASGLTNKEAASRLQISVRTVEKHRERAMEKLNLRSVVELTKFAIVEGMVRLYES